MKKTIYARVGGLLIAGLFTLLLSSSAAAAVTSGVTITPTSVNKEIKPGASYSGEVQVINAGETEFNFNVYAAPYSVTGEEYNPDFTPIPGAVDISSWFEFSETSGRLKVDGKQDISYTVTLPENTKPGSYYGAIFAETEDTANGGVVTRKRVGTLFYVRASGTAVEEGKIDAWNVPWLQRNPMEVVIKMANSGTVHYVSDIRLDVSDIFGSSKTALSRETVIIPQKLRKITIPWKDGSTFGLFKVSATVSYLGKTETLPTKYVLVASTMMRVFMLGTLLVFIVTMVVLGKKSVADKK